MAAPQVLVYRPSTGTPQQFASVFPGNLATGGPVSVPGNGATPAWYNALASALKGNIAGLQGRGVIINGMGSYLFASPTAGFGPNGPGFDGEPATVAALVQAGYVWVDACAIPVTGRWIPSNVPSFTHWGYEAIAPDFWAGGHGAAELLSAMGFPASTLNSDPAGGWPQPWAPAGTNPVIAGGVAAQMGQPYPYPTGFTVNADPPVGWPGNVLFPGVYPLPALASAPFGWGLYQGVNQWTVSMFAVQYGQGLYVYCDQDNGVGVTPGDASSFIAGCLAGTTSIQGPWHSATPPGPPSGGPGNTLLIALGILGAGALLIAAADFSAHYILARAGASTTVVETGPERRVREAG